MAAQAPRPKWNPMRFDCRQPYATAAEKDLEENISSLPQETQQKILKAVKELRDLEFQDGRDDTQFNGW